MTCHEARSLLYDAQLSRSFTPDNDERASLLVLAKAHLHVCLACNEFFEHERALLSTLHDRFEHAIPPAPTVVLHGVLNAVHTERLLEHAPSQPRRTWFERFRRWLGR